MIATILIGSPFIAFVSQMATNVFDGEREGDVAARHRAGRRRRHRGVHARLA